MGNRCTAIAIPPPAFLAKTASATVHKTNFEMDINRLSDDAK